MPASRNATHRSFTETEVESDLALVDAHAITPDEHDEVPEVTDEMVARAKFHVDGKPVARGRPLKPDAKEAVSIRLSPAVLAHFRASGPGWQTRINQILLDIVRRESAPTED